MPTLLAVGGWVWHLGALHPVEKGLTIALALGPFVVLGIVVAVRRHQERHGSDDAQP